MNTVKLMNTVIIQMVVIMEMTLTEVTLEMNLMMEKTPMETRIAEEKVVATVMDNIHTHHNQLQVLHQQWLHQLLLYLHHQLLLHLHLHQHQWHHHLQRPICSRISMRPLRQIICQRPPTKQIF